VTQEGWQVWDLVGRLGGQMRLIPGAVIGWDMGAALAMAAALGIDTLVAAELLPEIEAVMVRKLNEEISANQDGAFRP
jgi:pimeloyl-ACP methyl ester carboxylesterase